MPVRIETRWFTPEMCRERPDALFAFGDNLVRAGRGPGAGQAVIRDEPNAVGIPTKRRPARDEGAYLTDADMEAFKEAAAEPFRRLSEHLRAGGTVVWPADGIGTGRAELAARAPRIWASLERALEKLEGIQAEAPPPPLSITDVPLVRATLAAFPGARIVAIRDLAA